ncbi:MAG TPA: hypothetical protein RMH99_25550 [Sandaracinaceae bacterium LLY-WYZ-13_1]|nr:hypothetical protein [Sandaracinaceae bacterium LLY-WYZ-13_1]
MPPSFHRAPLSVALGALLGLAACGEAPAEPPPSDAGRASVDAASSGRDAARVDAAQAPDASDPEAPDAGRDDGDRGVFVASGHLGRTVVSCDDGRTWVADRSLDDAARCFEGGLDCDHHPGAARGIAFGAGWVFTTHGWGEGGAVRRSRDGARWEPVTDGTLFGGIAWGAGRLVGGARPPRLSDDAGEGWRDGGDTGLRLWNVRRTAYADVAGGRFVLVANDGGANDVVLSADGGERWWSPSRLPAGCGAGIQDRGGIAGADGLLVILGGDGLACRSEDGGDTWTAHRVTDGAIDSHLVHTGGRFVAWSRGARHASEDGETWIATPTDPPDLSIEAVAHDPATGTFVAVERGWGEWYEEQALHRSADGVSWTPVASFVGGHPLRFVASGRLPSCPD